MFKEYGDFDAVGLADLAARGEVTVGKAVLEKAQPWIGRKPAYMVF